MYDNMSLLRQAQQASLMAASYPYRDTRSINERLEAMKKDLEAEIETKRERLGDVELALALAKEHPQLVKFADVLRRLGI